MTIDPIHPLGPPARTPPAVDAAAAVHRVSREGARDGGGRGRRDRRRAPAARGPEPVAEQPARRELAPGSHIDIRA